MIMGMKPNQRIALTKELIHRALISLLKKQDIHKISIRELCDIAGINRTTFYNHYGSQYDVLAEIRDWYIKDIADAIESTDLCDSAGVLHRVTLVFSYMEQNLEISRLLIQNNFDETFAHRLFSLPKIEVLLAEYRKAADDHRYDEDIASFALYGSYRLLQNWIAEDDRRSAEEMAQIVMSLTGAVCSTGTKQ